jgi:hypothetical protein
MRCQVVPSSGTAPAGGAETALVAAACDATGATPAAVGLVTSSGGETADGNNGWSGPRRILAGRDAEAFVVDMDLFQCIDSEENGNGTAPGNEGDSATVPIQRVRATGDFLSVNANRGAPTPRSTILIKTAKRRSLAIFFTAPTYHPLFRQPRSGIALDENFPIKSRRRNLSRDCVQKVTLSARKKYCASISSSTPHSRDCTRGANHRQALCQRL